MIFAESGKANLAIFSLSSFSFCSSLTVDRATSNKLVSASLSFYINGRLLVYQCQCVFGLVVFCYVGRRYQDNRLVQKAEFGNRTGSGTEITRSAAAYAAAISLMKSVTYKFGVSPAAFTASVTCG